MLAKNLGLSMIVTNYPDEDGNYHKELLVYANPALITLEEIKLIELC
jgi:hypothetical protein